MSFVGLAKGNYEFSAKANPAITERRVSKARLKVQFIEMPKSVNKIVDAGLKSLADDGELSIRINGICMQPLINDGAKVSVCKQKFYWPGDVLVKRSANDQLIAHRLIGIFPRKGTLYFVSRADNAEYADAPVAKHQILGRVKGGECAASVVSVPLRYRVRALAQFGLLGVRRIAYRASGLFGG